MAAISGDARRALEICRRAAEIADYHVKKAFKTAPAAGNLFSADFITSMQNL